MKIVPIAAAFGALLLSVSAQAKTANPIDGRFAVMASVSNTFEIKESRLALERSRNPEIRAFARWMISDHGRALHGLERASLASGADAAPTLDGDHEAKVTRLAGLDGDEFDQAYVADQVEAHHQTVKMLSDFEQMGTDAALLRWSRMTLPTVELHLGHFEALAADH